MNFSQIDALGSNDERMKAVVKKVTDKSYDGSARKDDEKWSATDIVTQFRTSASAPLASCVVGGATPSGKVVKRIAMTDTLIVKLKVLSRHACYTDGKEKRIITDPTSTKQVLSTEKPVKGDVVRIKKGAALTNPVTGAALTVYERNRAIAAGEPLFEYEIAEVDGDGCISVPLGDAISMLNRNGFRIAFPEHNQAHSSIKDTEEGQKRRITNWLYEEVGAGYTTKKPKAPKAEPKQEATPGADK